MMDYEAFCKLVVNKDHYETFLLEAASRGDVDVLRFLFHNQCSFPSPSRHLTGNTSPNIGNLVIEKGHFPCVEFLQEIKYEWSDETLTTAAEHGQYEILKYLHEQGHVMNTEVIEVATRHGHLACVKYAHEQSVKGPEWLCTQAAESGTLACLQFLYETGDYHIDADTIEIAAENGYLDCVQYLIEQKCEMDEYVCSGAATFNNLEILKLLHEHGCPWDENTFRCAVRHGNFECMQYLYENKCPWDAAVMSAAVLSGECSLKLLDYLYERKCPDNEFVMLTAVEAMERFPDNFAVIEYLCERQCPMNERACREAARYQSSYILAYLHQRNCPWDIETCRMAAFSGSVECLEYAIRYNAMGEAVKDLEAMKRVSEDVCNVNILKSLLKYGWPLHDSVAEQAVEEDNVEVLTLLHEHKFPLDKKLILLATKYGHLSCVRFLYGIYSLSPITPQEITFEDEGPVDNRAECVRFLIENGVSLVLDA